MNKRYIDFVPVRQNGQPGGVVPTGHIRRPVRAGGRPARAARIVQTQEVYRELPELREDLVSLDLPVGDLAGRGFEREVEVDFGVIEDLPTRTASEEVAERRRLEAARVQQMADAKKTYEIPKSPFINQASVQKRPLSKNVYLKKLEAESEKSSAMPEPVTIVSRKEKDSKSGLVVGIVATVILGAVAGVVAFLLLSK